MLVASLAAAAQAGTSRCLPVGLPVAARPQPARPVRQDGGRFVVLLAGGAEGGGGLARRSAALLRAGGDVDVVVACGRNERLRRRLTERSRRAGGRFTVLGYVDNFADWLGRADVVVTKAGPAIIAEAACAGTPLLLTSHLPGQERGNAELVLRAGAGRSARGVRGMLAELAAMRADDDVLAELRAGAAALAKPDAAARAAAAIASLTRRGRADERAVTGSGVGGRTAVPGAGPVAGAGAGGVAAVPAAGAVTGADGRVAAVPACSPGSRVRAAAGDPSSGRISAGPAR